MATLNYAFKELSCKLVYYGCGLCGKTTNLIHIHKTVPQKFRGELVSLATEQDRTLFFDFLPLDLGEVKGFKTKFQLYTVPGQVYYNATRKLVLRGVDGIVFVADSQKDRFQENIDSLENLKQNLEEYGYRLAESPTDFEGIPWVIQYNKRDMPQVSEIEDMQKALNAVACPSYEAVAVSGKGVKDTLKGISSLVIKKLNADPVSPVAGESSKTSSPSAPSKAPAAQAASSNDEYSELSEKEMEDAESSSQQPSKPSLPNPKPASPAPQPEATPEPAQPAASGQGNVPQLTIFQQCKAKLRGMGLGGGNLTLANLAGDTNGLYQLTGKISFLGIFGGTWSRKLRYTGTVEKEVDGQQVELKSFVSEDEAGPALEVFVKEEETEKKLFINYIGKMGQVQIVPPGNKPIA